MKTKSLKQQMLEMSGLSEKEFYNVYDTEEKFMAKFGKRVKKLQMGDQIGKVSTNSSLPLSLTPYLENVQRSVFGTTQREQEEKALKLAQIEASKNAGAKQSDTGGIDIGQIMSIAAMVGAKNGRKLKKAQTGENLPFEEGMSGETQEYTSGWAPNTSSFKFQPNQFDANAPISIGDMMGNSSVPNLQGMPAQNIPNPGFNAADALYEHTPVGEQKKSPLSSLPFIGKIAQGVEAFNDEQDNAKRLKGEKNVTGLMTRAAAIQEKLPPHQYWRPEDLRMTGDEFFPTHGVGTNVLARNGGEIQNTYTPNTMYTQLGYPQAQDGLTAAMNSGMSDKLSNIASSQFDFNAGTQLGGGIGSLAGAAFGIPGLDVVGSALGGAIDDAWGPAGKIKKEQQGIDNNINSMAFGQGMKGFHNQHRGMFEDGGWMNPEYNPQVITKFGDLSAQDYEKFAHQLRTGGNLRQNQMAMGGDLQVERGEAQPYSYNPYLPEGGETVMFRGPSHAEGGMPISYGNNPVEVEGGEPATKLQDGGGASDLVVFGNLQIPKGGKEMIGDINANGKFKTYIANLSKKENRQNKFIEDSTIKIGAIDVRDPFDRLTFNSLKRNIEGANMKLQSFAENKQNAAHLQSAINDTAGEFGLVADDLAKGKIKTDKTKLQEYAEFGKGIPKAQNGGTGSKWGEGDREYSLWKNQNRISTDTPETRERFEAYKKHEETVNALDKDWGLYKKWIAYKYPNSGNTQEGTRGPSKVVSYDDFKDKVYQYGIEKAWHPEFRDWYNKNIRKTASTSPPKTTTEQTTEPLQTINISSGNTRSNQSTSTRTEGGYTSKYGLSAWLGNTRPGDPYGMRTKSDFTTQEWDQVADNLGFKGYGNKEFQEFLLTNPQAEPLIQKRHQELYHTSPFIDNKLGHGWEAPELKNISKWRPNSKSTSVEDLSKGLQPLTTIGPRTPAPEAVTTIPKTTINPWAMVNNLLPYIRPSDAEELDPRQLMGEMYALSNNQIEPVQAQSYHPQLGVPYDISMQDIRNQNQADYRSSQRTAGYNPAAQAALDAQKYTANEKVTGEEFRMNQGMKDKVYGENRATINDAQLKNLQMYDTQATRQAEAKSNTKAVAQAALSSISNKFLQNQLQNKQLQTYENLYNYRYDDKGRIWNWNGPAQINTQGNATSPNTIANMPANRQVLYEYDPTKGGYTPYNMTSKAVPPTPKPSKSKNGAIVKAIKNL